MALQAAVLSHPRLAQAATAFATTLANRLGCERVSVGFVERGFSKVIALSHGSTPDEETDVIALLSEAMDEAIGQRNTVRLPALPGTPPRIEIAHRILQQRTRLNLCTIPLVIDREAVGAVLFEFSDEQKFDRSQLMYCEHQISLIGPVLELMRENERPLGQRMQDAISARWKTLWAPGSAWRRWLILAAVAVAAGIAFVPLPHEIGGHARIEGAVQRTLVAPADGFLKQAHVKPGEQVEAGQLLAELADEDLLIELRKLSSELAQHENAYASALARADRAELVINQAKADETRARLELIEQQLARTRIEAPFAGVVIQGDLSQSLGAPVKRGEALLMLAPTDQFRAIVQIDERDISMIEVGQSGKLALSAQPWDPITIQVSRVTPMAVAVEGNNVFEVEATLQAPDTVLKPGLQGVARISSEPRSLLSRWTRRAVEWLALKVWAWWGI